MTKACDDLIRIIYLWLKMKQTSVELCLFLGEEAIADITSRPWCCHNFAVEMKQIVTVTARFWSWKIMHQDSKNRARDGA